MARKTNLNTIQRVYNVQDSDLPNLVDWNRQCNVYWTYYNNTMFDKFIYEAQTLARYRKDYELYRYTRMLFNPAVQAVDFWNSCIYPGVLSDDTKPLTHGVPNAIPLSQSTSEELRSAIGQLYQWSNWQSKIELFVKYTSAIGSSLVEVLDDTRTGKVHLNVVWPGKVAKLSLDDMGNVKSYRLEYEGIDKQGKTFRYAKEVDNSTIKHFRDNEPYDIDGFGDTIIHNYGFCPAIWTQHGISSSQAGESCFQKAIAVIDQSCSTASHAVDLLDRLIESPIVFWADGTIKSAIGSDKEFTSKDEFATLPEGAGASKKEATLILKGPKDGRSETLAPNVDLGSILSYIEMLNKMASDLLPEIDLYKQMRSMSQMTGIAIERIMGDVTKRVAKTAANYDIQLKKLLQMAVAIAGHRANSTWAKSTTLTTQQEKFRAFDLTSYNKGLLDFDILPRSIVAPTLAELAQERIAYWQGVEAVVSSGTPIELVLADDGFTQDRIDAIVANRASSKAKSEIETVPEETITSSIANSEGTIDNLES